MSSGKNLRHLKSMHREMFTFCSQTLCIIFGQSFSVSELDIKEATCTPLMRVHVFSVPREAPTAARQREAAGENRKHRRATNIYNPEINTT